MTNPSTATVRRYCGVCKEEHDLPWGVCLYAALARLSDAAWEVVGTCGMENSIDRLEEELNRLPALPAPPGEGEGDE